MLISLVGVTVHDGKISQNATSVRNASTQVAVSTAPPLKQSRPRPTVKTPKRKLEVQQVTKEALHLILPQKLTDLERVNDGVITTYV